METNLSAITCETYCHWKQVNRKSNESIISYCIVKEKKRKNYNCVSVVVGSS